MSIAAKKAFLVVVLLVSSALPASCHFAWSGPFLYSHNSSSAFDWWLALWVLALGWGVFMVLIIKELLMPDISAGSQKK